MYVTIVPNRNSKPASLLRESYREGGKVKNRTLANLSHLAPDVIDVIKRALSGEKMVSAEAAVQTEKTTPAGHVRAVLGAMKNLGVAELVSVRRSRERDLVLGMIAERVLHPTSKLGTVRLWKTSTLAEDLGVDDAKPEELYGALDWLLGRQARIETKLAARHLSEGGLALYDTSNSLYEGRTCALAHLGHDKDNRRGASVIGYGVMTDREGRPVSIEVYPGNTSDPATVPGQVLKLRARYGLDQVVVVGDRGMLTRPNIELLKQNPGLGWITALRTEAIRKLVDGEALQLSLFDQVNLAEIRSPDFPDERLVACFNPLLADERKRKRGELLEATEKLLEKLAAEVAGRTKKPLKAGEIGKKVGRVMHRHKVAKHFLVEIADGALTWSRDEESIRREAELDGIYVIRTSEPAERLSAEDTVRSYKRLAEVERAFRCMKGIDLRVRPIFLRNEDHVRAHFFLCMLAYYVEWHMRRALAPLLFQDEDVVAERETRDAVAKPEPSASVKAKKNSKRTPDALPVQSFSTLLADLATQARVTYRVGCAEATFDQLAKPSPLHQRVFDLLGV
ncbi:MAG: IS1634 family transposase [Deltaproteobacteria bacterium]|nr:IS1634 family transposase [Deltaproteobacteria bacterium]